MKTSSAAALLIAGLFCVLAARADEAWLRKPPAEWSEKDIRHILEHSAWARRVPLLLVRPDGEAKPCMGSKGPCEREDTFHAPDNSNSSMATHQPSQDLVRQVSGAERQQEYTGAGDFAQGERSNGVEGIAVVRWASARTVREALERLVPPSGKRMTADDLAPLAAPNAYVLYVDLRVPLGSVSQVPQSGVLSERMARRSVLIPKSTGQKIHALRVVSAPLPEFDDRKELALAAYYIYFPKEKDGRAVLPESERDVRFECPLAPLPIRADFKLSRMEREGSRDF